MTNTDDTPRPESSKPEAEPRRRRKRRWLFAGGIGLLAAITGICATRAFAHPAGFRRFGHVDSEGELRERIGRGADFALWKVSASDTQRKRVEEILDRAAPQLFASMQKGKEHRRAFMDALAGGDRGSTEQSRKQALAWADETSRLWLATLEEALSVLTPDQRATVREHMQRFGGHGRHGI